MATSKSLLWCYAGVIGGFQIIFDLAPIGAFIGIFFQLYAFSLLGKLPASTVLKIAFVTNTIDLIVSDIFSPAYSSLTIQLKIIFPIVPIELLYLGVILSCYLAFFIISIFGYAIGRVKTTRSFLSFSNKRSHGTDNVVTDRLYTRT